MEKVEALKHYKFSLAFENTNEEDYVTEKFFQSLVAGMYTSPSLYADLSTLVSASKRTICADDHWLAQRWD